MTRLVFAFLTLAFVATTGSADARPWRLAQMPNAPASCNTCHTTGGGTPRDAFGLAVEARVTPGGTEDFWGPELAALDSDGDGFTNGQELGDPDGDGVPDPNAEVTRPGLASSFPASVTITLNLTGMTPHLGQRFEARVVDRATGQEADRVSLSAIASVDFSVVFEHIPTGGDYDVDFYADLNRNGRYDAPPADHAWRMTVDNAAGAPTLAFAHNTSFTDVGFPDYGGVSQARNRALVTAMVTRNGAPVDGVDVAFSQSVSGRRSDYRWRGVTDATGTAQVDIRVDPARYWRTGASGYYVVRATDLLTGVLVGQWNSVPVNGGRETAISLPVGGQASADETSLLTAVSGAVLEGNYPNPFNPATQIRYALPEAALVRLTVYNSLGQEVARLVDARQAAGRYSVTWKAGGVATGVYYSVMETAGDRQVRRMLLLK